MRHDLIDWLSTNQQALLGIGGLATAVAATAAVFTLIRAGMESTARTRPYVLAEYRVVPYGFSRLDLVIRNSGVRAARDLSVRFDPPFKDSESPGEFGRYAARRYGAPIAVLGPGQEFSNILMYNAEQPDKSDMPELLSVKISYGGPWWRGGRYRDEILLHRTLYTQHLFSESSESPNGRMKKIAVQLEEIAKALKAIQKVASDHLEQ